MAGFQRSVTIDRPPAEVWAFLVDLRNAARWMPGHVGITRLDDGPLRVGTRFEETRTIAGRTHTATVEVVEHVPGKVHAASAQEKGVRGTYRYVLSDAPGGGTRVRLEADVEATTFLARLAVGAVVRVMEDHDGDQLERLKRALEG